MKKNARIKKEAVIVLLLLILLIENGVLGQGAESSNESHYLHEIYVNACGGIMNKLQIHNTGEDYLGSKHTITPILEFGFREKVLKSFGLTAGASANSIPFNTNFNVTIDSSSIIPGTYELNENEYHIMSYNLFLMLTWERELTEKFFLSTGLGVQYNHIHENSMAIGLGYHVYSETEDKYITMFRFMIDNANSSRNYISYRGNIVLNYRIGKKQLIGIGITLNYCPENIGEAKYIFSHTPGQSYGTGDLGMNYVGLALKYGFRF